MGKILSQVLALQQGRKESIDKEISQLATASTKLDQLTGFVNQYQALNEEDHEQFSDEAKKVQAIAPDILSRLSQLIAEEVDIEATKDNTNCFARADIILSGIVWAKDVPVTTLLYLEKRLTAWRAIISKIPMLDASENWTPDTTQQGLWRSETRKTHRTKKVPKPITLAPATTEFPAQVQMIAEDQVVGYYHKVILSGALPATRWAQLMQQANQLIDAVRMAREQANTVPAQDLKIGQAIFDYLMQ